MELKVCHFHRGGQSRNLANRKREWGLFWESKEWRVQAPCPLSHQNIRKTNQPLKKQIRGTENSEGRGRGGGGGSLCRLIAPHSSANQGCMLPFVPPVICSFTPCRCIGISTLHGSCHPWFDRHLGALAAHSLLLEGPTLAIFNPALCFWCPCLVKDSAQHSLHTPLTHSTHTHTHTYTSTSMHTRA